MAAVRSQRDALFEQVKATEAELQVRPREAKKTKRQRGGQRFSRSLSLNVRYLIRACAALRGGTRTSPKNQGGERRIECRGRSKKEKSRIALSTEFGRVKTGSVFFASSAAADPASSSGRNGKREKATSSRGRKPAFQRRLLGGENASCILMHISSECSFLSQKVFPVLGLKLEAQTVAQSRLRSERISLQTQLQKLQAEVQRPLSFQVRFSHLSVFELSQFTDGVRSRKLRLFGVFSDAKRPGFCRRGGTRCGRRHWGL